MTRVALVTGADGGLGSAIKRRLEGDGWRVIAAVSEGGEFSADVSDSAACEALVDSAVAAFGRLDLVVNNAAYMTLAPVDEHPVDDWWRVVETNLSGPFYIARRAADALARAGGSIVNISSRMGIAGGAGGTAYAASKAGLIGLTKALALELAPDVRVNAIAPGPVDTPQLAVDARHRGRSLAAEREAAVAAAPLRRLVSPHEVAGTVLFLVSTDGAHYTGQVLSPNGGVLL